MQMRSLLGLVSLILATAVTPAMASGGKTYQRLYVQYFDVPGDAEFPPDFREALRRNLIRHLLDTKRFSNVTVLDPGQPAPTDADIVLTGKIVKYKKGSRFKRYMVPGLGATSIRAFVEFVDPAGQTLLKKDVSGTVRIGAFGGDSKGATNGLAKELAKAAKKNLP